MFKKKISFDLTKYKNFFGKPGKGIHSKRIFGIALVDLIATLFITLLIAIPISKKNLKKKLLKNFIIVLTSLFLLAIIIHRAFDVRTTIDKLLFPNAK